MLYPRTVFCTRGGLFTGLLLRETTAAEPTGTSVGLDVCCTTTVFVEGLGDFGQTCVQLGNGTLSPTHCYECFSTHFEEPRASINYTVLFTAHRVLTHSASSFRVPAVTDKEQGAAAWGKGEICNDTSVISNAAVENSGVGAAAQIKSLFVNCVDRVSNAETVLDHVGITFSPAGVDYLSVYTRTVPPAPLSSELMATLGIAPKTAQVARVRPVELFKGCAAEVAGDGGEGDGSAAADSNEWIFFAADLQCQGLRHDRCTCVAGQVKCVLGTPSGGWEAKGMVREGDLLAMQTPGWRPDWCRDSDPVEGWLLLAVRPAPVATRHL